MISPVGKIAARLAIAAFLIVDVVLVVAVYRHVNAEPAAVALPSPVSADTDLAEEAPADEQRQDPYDLDPAQSYLLSLSDDGSLLSARRGQCDGRTQAEVQVSDNGGATLRDVDTGLSEVVAVRADSASDLTVIGAESDCVLRQRTSTDGGSTWLDGYTFAGTFDVSGWHPDLDKETVVVSDKRTSEPGCSVTSLSDVSEVLARVSCADGTIIGTGDGGDSWVKLGRLDNVRVASYASPSKAYALAKYQGCAANAFVTRDGGRTWSPGGCISGDPAQALTQASDRLVARVDGGLYVSRDEGASWSPAS